MRYVYFVALLISVLTAQGAVKTMRCGGSLVSFEDRAFEVQRKCGTPNYRDFIGYEDESNSIPIEEWIYEQPSSRDGKPHYLLRFQAGKLKAIEYRIPSN